VVLRQFHDGNVTNDGDHILIELKQIAFSGLFPVRPADVVQILLHQVLDHIGLFGPLFGFLLPGQYFRLVSFIVTIPEVYCNLSCGVLGISYLSQPPVFTG
jgi:hypothetical protein